MKHFNLKKLMMMLALIIIVQNGAVIANNTAEGTGSYTEEEGVAPCSDQPLTDDIHDLSLIHI